jgi:lipopolysaccharide export system permease protein
MLTIDRALMREALQTSIAVTLVFISLFVVVSLVNVLAEAAMGEVPARIVLLLLGLQTVKIVGMLLPLALFVGTLLTLGRWYRDSEMTVLAACGVSLVHFVRPLLVLATGFALVAGLFSFYLAPMSASIISKLRSDESSKYEAAGVIPGVFNEVRYVKGTYYVEQVDRRNAALKNIFVSSEQTGKEGVLVAERGYQYKDKDSGDRFLVLQNGTRYEGVPGEADFRVTTFEKYVLRVELPEPRVPLKRFETLPTMQLLSMDGASSGTGAAAEWHWRLSRPVTLYLLALLALVFSYTHPRRGRYGGLFVAVLVYFVYTNLLGVSDALLKQGRIPSALGMWWVHGGFLLLAVYLLYRRSNNLPLIPRPARKVPTS